MEAWIIIVAIIVILVVLIISRVVYELHHLEVTRYNLRSSKISSDSGFLFAFLSDLHYREYGKNNEDLIKKIKDANPECILIGGDLIVNGQSEKIPKLLMLLKELRKIAPVYYALGNHECRFAEINYENRYDNFAKACKDIDIKILRNEKAALAKDIDVFGLDLEFEFYEKFKKCPLSEEDIKDSLSCLDKTRYNILLAHTPKFFDIYRKFDVDIVLSGHYHGGAVRLGNRGVISPQFKLFPKHSGGFYYYPDTNLLVTRGCGSHKVNLRLFNKPEVVIVKIDGVRR